MQFVMDVSCCGLHQCSSSILRFNHSRLQVSCSFPNTHSVNRTILIMVQVDQSIRTLLAWEVKGVGLYLQTNMTFLCPSFGWMDWGQPYFVVCNHKQNTWNLYFGKSWWTMDLVMLGLFLIFLGEWCRTFQQSPTLKIWCRSRSVVG